MGKTKRLFSNHVRFGRRTYFFDTNETESGEKYLKITESKFMGEGKDRIYNSIILKSEDVGLFSATLNEARTFLMPATPAV